MELRNYFSAKRLDFPIIANAQVHGKKLIYLDSAATSHKPKSVIEAMQTFYLHDYATVHRTIYSMTEQATAAYEAVRSQIKRHFQLSPSKEVIFTRGTTDALNLVASSLSTLLLKPGDEVILSAMEHHSNIVPWQMACERLGAKLRVIPFDAAGVLDLESYRKFLQGGRAKIVAVAHMANSTGTIHPIREMANLAHEYGAYLVVDGAQSAAHLSFSLEELKADFYCFSSHKLYGPTGVGCLIADRGLLERMPPYQGGGDMIRQVTFEKTTYNDPPLKFEAGTPMIAEVIGLGAAFSYLEQIDLKKLEQWENHLLQQATEGLKELPGLRILGEAPKKGPILTFIVEGVHPLDLATLLDLDGIAVRSGHLCAQPTLAAFGTPYACRASFSLYNTEEEISAFLASLQKTLKKLK